MPARPKLRGLRRADLQLIHGLGATTGMMTTLFPAAICRIPLGTAVAIEFLGPLPVAAFRSHNNRALAWPTLALALTAPIAAAAIFGVRQTTGHMSWDVVLASIARDDTAADPDVVP